MSDQFYKIRNKLKRQASEQPKPGRFDKPLSEDYGYAPDASDGERWVIFENNILIVIHPNRPPRIYPKGCKGRYTELTPELGGRIHVRRT